MKHSILSAAILGALGLGSTFSALAANNFTVNMCVGEVPDAGVINSALDGIPVWGYAEGGASAGACVNTPSLPGPTIRIPDTDSNNAAYDGLTVNLVNTMTRPTSLVIPGTIKLMAPVTFNDSTGLPRVYSFDAETPPDGTTVVSYSWDNLPSGSYMYHSGTQPQVQVAMGLYGGVINDEVEGSEAYPGKTYDQDVVVFYNEIDPAQNISAAAGEFDVVNGEAKSTIDYNPTIHLLIVDEDALLGNQVSFEFTDVPTIKVTSGLDPLFRLFNGGQRLHVPTVANAMFDVIARDGKVLPNTASQYTVSLPPLKVKDAVLNISGGASDFPSAGSFRLTDSAMNISNPVSLGGAVLALSDDDAATDHSNASCKACLRIERLAKSGYVEPELSAEAPLAVKDKFTVLEGDKVSNILSKALSNDRDTSGGFVNLADYTVEIKSQPGAGVLVNDGGSLHYQHGGGENEHDSIVYSITNAAGESSDTSITISVAPVNDAPNAEPDTVSTSLNNAVIEIRALNNDSDVDSDGIRIVSVGSSSLGDLEAQDQVIIFRPAAEGTDVVSYQIEDTEGLTASADISITVTERSSSDGGVFGGGSGSSGDDGDSGIPPVAMDDNYIVLEGGTLDIAESETIRSVLSNDSGATAVDTTLKVYPEHGTIEMRENGTFVYVHDGSEDDDDRFVYESYNADGRASAEVVIQIKQKLDAPKVNNDKANTKVNTPVLIDLLRNDKDKDSALDPNGIVITKQPLHGTVEIVTAGEVRYTPDADYKGKDHFRYRLKDSVTGELSQRAAKVKVRIKTDL